MSNRCVISNGTTAQEVSAMYIAHEGEIKTVLKAFVAEGGVIRQYWPPAGDGSDPNILWTNDPITVRDEAVDPANASAVITFTRSTGQFSYSNDPDPDLSGTYLSPPLDGTAGDNGKYLIKCSPTSGTISGDATGVWLDLNSQATFSWNVDQSGVGTANATAIITIAQDDGAGNPVFNSDVDKTVTFIAEVAAANDIAWTNVERDVEEIKTGIDADCVLTFFTDGTCTGDGDDASFAEDWHRLAPTPGDLTGWTVQVDLVSGTAPSGAPLGSALALSSQRAWTLSATTEQDFSCELDVTVSDGVDSVVKRVNMHSQRTDPTNDVVWTTAPLAVTETGQDEETTAVVRMKNDGEGNAEGIAPGGGIAWTEDWHSEAPAPTDAGSYEVNLIVDSGDAPTGGDSFGAGVWLNLGTSRNWFLTIPAPPPPGVILESGVWNITVRRVGMPSTEVTKPVTVTVNREPAEGGA